MKKFISGILASITFMSCIPYYFDVINNPMIIVEAVEFEPTEGIYENLTYVKYDDHIEITHCDESAISVVIPSEIEGLPVTSIGGVAFFDCTGLTEITIPDSVTSIGYYSFHGTAWYKNQPDGLIYAGKVAHRYKGEMPENTSVRLKEGTVSIGDSAFFDCTSLTEIKIPDSVTYIGRYAFSGCTDLTKINIPDGVTSIEDFVFCNCASLKEVTIPDSVTSIGSNTFYGCTSLTEIKIPNKVTCIGDFAFSFCESLTEVTIPYSVILIRYHAFSACNNLKKVIILSPDCAICFGAIPLETIVYGYEDSFTHECLDRNKFIALDAVQEIKGDANNDSVLDVADVVAVASYVGNPEANPLDEQCIKNADVHNKGDGLTANDALMIQQYLAKIIENL
ncbi:MAG: leucine-rich repeat domain-containing protein [Oscillospiraceae bacterium]|nr:leucine-rich repeat domain-containing protein [Oscillospiraceae bacterium]